MDPALLSLIFMGLRVVAQGMRACSTRGQFLNELEEFLVGVHAEGRTVTPEELMEWAAKAGVANRGYQEQLDAFLKAINALPVQRPTPPEEAPVAHPVEAPAVPPLGSEG